MNQQPGWGSPRAYPTSNVPRFMPTQPNATGQHNGRSLSKKSLSSNKRSKSIGNKRGIFKDSAEWWTVVKVFMTALGATLAYGAITNFTLLNGGIFGGTLEQQNLAYILSAIASGAAFAFVSYNYIDTEAVYASPVDSALAYLHSRADTGLVHTVSRIIGNLAGAFLCAALLFIVYPHGEARIKNAASVVNPFNNPNNGSDFTAFCLETIGIVVLGLACFALDAQGRKAMNRALMKGILMFGMRIFCYQYTTASFNGFLSLAINATTGTWNTFAPGSYYIFPVSSIVGFAICVFIVLFQRFFARMLAKIKKAEFDHSKSSSQDHTPKLKKDKSGKSDSQPLIKIATETEAGSDDD